MNLVLSLSPSFSISLFGTVLCVLVVTTPTYEQTEATAKAADSPPQWAYPENHPNYKPPVDDGKPVRVPNRTAGYTWTQLRTRFIAPVWHPEDHGPLPDIVAKGRDSDVFACGFCHRADGPGGPENADLAGLPKGYLIQQMADYKRGARITSVSSRLPPTLMIGLSKSITDAEVEAAAVYFSALKPRKGIKVVESDMVPKSYIAGLVWAAGGER
jgi:cytochrome c553